MTPEQSVLLTAARDVAEMLAGDTGHDIADNLTCKEAETLAFLLEAAGYDSASFIAAHKEGDEEGEHAENIES